MSALIPENALEIVIRLTLALILGGLIGIERAGTNHDAGLRTHILVCLGAAGVMVMSETMHIAYGGDIGRIGAQVVSGIGFLGAGCIILNGNRVKGLTTAAGLWTTGCVGLIVGMGYYFIAFILVALVLIAMLILRPITKKMHLKYLKNDYTLKIVCNSRLKNLNHYFEESHLITYLKQEDNTYFVSLKSETDDTLNHLVFELLTDEGIISVEKI